MLGIILPSLAHFAGSLTLLLSHARPSKMPSPVVAQLGSTFQVWSFAIRCRSNASETSFGRIATPLLSVKSPFLARFETPTTRNILLVRKYQQQRILHFAILYYSRQFAPRLLESIAIVAVDDKDQTLCAREVMSP